MECPVCKSTDKGRHVEYERNGVYGPGSFSKKTNEYFVCFGCGVHYTDLNKKD